MERDQDQRRLRTSLLISLAIWAVFMPLLSLLKFMGPPPPIESMNPVFVELASPEAPPRIAPKPPSAATPSDADRAGSEPAAAVAAGGGGGRTAAGPSASASGEAAAPAPALRADPSASAIPAPKTRSASPYQGGSDPFGRLSEDSLRGEEAPAPVPTPAPAARTATAQAKTTSRPADPFDQSLGKTAEKLASGGGGTGTGGTGSSGTAAGRATDKGAPGGTGSGSSSGTGTGRGRGSGDLNGGLDFGGGATRQLYSSRRVRVPDKLLSDQPKDLAYTVSFVVESGGTVLPNTIRFEPPVARADLEAFLRTVFSAWEFSFADSDGQVVFRYSIKVQ